MHGPRRTASALACLAIPALLAACSTDPAGNGGNGGGNSIADPDFLRTFLAQKIGPASTGVMDGFGRLLIAAQGGGSDGVIITPTGPNSFTAALSVDLDGNGSRESTITGSLNGSLATGATISITGITDPAAPSLQVSASSDVRQVSGVSVLFENMSGTLSADPPGEGNAGSVTVTDGVVNLDIATPRPIGFIDVGVSGEGGASLDLSLSFEVAGSGWILRVSGDGVDFTLP